MSDVAELHKRGVAATNAGRFAEARRLLSRALRSANDPDLVARIESSMAHLEGDTGDGPAAIARCDRIVDRPGMSARTRAQVVGQRAMLRMVSGELSAALADFAAAIAGLSDVPAYLGPAHLNRGGVYLQLHDVAAAENDFRAAIPLLEGSGRNVHAAMAQHNLGYCRYLAGDLVEALRLMDQAAVVLGPLSTVSAATGQQDRAEVLMAAGLVDDGRAALREAAAAYGSRRLRRQQAEAELALARASVDIAPAEAAESARAAARHFRAAQAPVLATRADAVALAAAVRRGDRSRRLLERAATIEAAVAEQGSRWETRTVALHATRVRIERGDLTTAGDRLARTRVTAAAPLGVRLLDREVRAEYAAARGRRPDALRHLREGLTELHGWQSSFGSLDLQTMVAGHGRRLAVRALELAVESPRPDVLFEWSERTRMLASRIQAVEPAPLDERTVADLAELRAAPDPDREAELQRRVRESAWRRPGPGEVSDPVALADLRSALGEHHALAAYVATADRLVALVVTDRAVTRHHLGERSAIDPLLDGLLPDLDVAATDLPAPMRTAVRRELDDRLAELDAVLVAPLAEAIGDRRIVVTPSGALTGVPWPLLPGLRGRPVEVARSATAWRAGRATGEATALARAGLVAGPRVLRAPAEVAAAAGSWRHAEVLADAAATTAAVCDLAGRVDVLHIAAHGRHSADNPLFSGLELADGPWFGYDIDRLPTVPPVVLLSACEVGRSTVRHGEELIGMTTAWLHAGARAVIASPSAVSDAAAHDALCAVHAALRSGLDPAAALAQVPPGEAPAPFVCFV